MQKREEEQILVQPTVRLTRRVREYVKQLGDVGQYLLNPEDENPAVYCGTYRKYNEGNLFGAWIDLSSCFDWEDFMDVCHRLHADEYDPELMFQDFQYFPERWYSEGSFTEEKFDKILLWWSLDEDKQEAYEKYMWLFGDEDIEHFKKAYVGYFRNQEDFARREVSELYPYVANSNLEIYFNYEKYASDLFNGEYCWEDGYVFRNY